MKSNTDNSHTNELHLPATKILAALMGLISAGSATWFLNSFSLTWHLPPQTPSDYGNIILFFLTAIVLCISVWQLGWILLALIAKQSNSSILRILIHKFGTKGARALLSSSLVITGFSGTALAATQPELNDSTASITSQTYYRSETSRLFPTQQESNHRHTLGQASTMSDFSWGANLENPKSNSSETKTQTSPDQTYQIVNGDSLWKIAKNTLSQHTLRPSNQEINNYVIELYRQNKKVIGTNPNLIYPGMTLTLPLVGENITHHESLEGTK